MNLVDWNEVDPEYKWVTGDCDGITLFENPPYWNDDYRCFLPKGGGGVKTISRTWQGFPLVEERPTNKAGDPPAIIPVIKETLDLLDYLAFEAGQRPSPEDRLKIVDHMRALSKALKEWENY